MREIYTEADYLKMLFKYRLHCGPGAKDLLPVLHFAQRSDPFYRTWEGYTRVRAALDLEFLFTQILMPGADWALVHRLFSQGSEQCNVLHGARYMQTLGLGHTIPERITERVSEIHTNEEALNMFLCYRGFFKSTVFTVAQAVQAVLINPNVRILFMSGTMRKAETLLVAAKSHFIRNPRFRVLFPEFCNRPNTTGAVEMGTTQNATVKNRTVHSFREPTFMAAGLETSLAGFHYDIIFLDDVIDEKNVTNEEQMEKAENLFNNIHNLFDNPSKPFYTICGTRYNNFDLYGKLMTKGLAMEGDTVFRKVIANHFSTVRNCVEEREILAA
jgi:hypothetical protein